MPELLVAIVSVLARGALVVVTAIGVALVLGFASTGSSVAHRHEDQKGDPRP